jgi:NAD(P)-dependent dehydrogenase (short-subunit alcohol dehydrogenase family)
VPGSVATPRVVALREAGLIGPWEDNPSPIGPPAETSDIASAILFFSSAMSANVTGQTLVVDGGRSICTPFPGTRSHARGTPAEP